MTNHQWLNQATKALRDVGVESTRLDALILLGDALAKDRAYVLAHPEIELTPEQEKLLQKLLSRRMKHEPLAYLRNKSEFYGREFTVNSHVLVPRPESETIIELLKIHQNHLHRVRPGASGLTILDVGTGSGALAITAKLELPQADVIGSDINPKCLAVATQNANKLNADVHFIEANLLDHFKQGRTLSEDDVLIVLANLPYVPDSYQINEAAKHEPSLALFGGDDGLDFYKILFAQLKELPGLPIFVFTESLTFQHHDLANIARTQNFAQIEKKDLIQVFTNQS